MEKAKIDSFAIRAPCDMHAHFREGAMLKNVLPFTSSVFVGAVAMGNLASGPIKNGYDVRRYRQEILAESHLGFEPIMSVMLVKSTTPQVIADAADAGAKVLKFIPGGTSTGSDGGISLYELEDYYPVLEKAREKNMILSIHLELIADENGREIPELNREYMAIPFLDKIITAIPGLPIVVEHPTTGELIDYICRAPKNVVATPTAHHAILNLRDVYDAAGKIKNPFLYCKPVAKTIYDRNKVIEAMVSGNSRFFFGSDSAPHLKEKKMANPPAAGIFTAPVVLPLLCEIFEKHGGDDWVKKLENFVSVFGPEFYGLPLSERKIIMFRKECIVPEEYEGVRIFKGGEKLGWTFGWRI